MVKLKSPFASQFASGTLGRELQYSQTKHGAVGGRRRRPRQPRTLAQRATRLWMTWFAGQWSQLDADELATWFHLGDVHAIAPYHAFIKDNIQAVRNQNNKLYYVGNKTFWPATAFPRTADTQPGAIANVGLVNIAGGFRHTINVTDQQDGWYVSWYYTKQLNRGVKYNQLIHIVPTPPIGVHVIEINDVPIGAAYTTWGACSRTGLAEEHFHQKTITPLPP